MKDNGIQADAVEKAEVDSELVDVVKHGATDLDDSEFCRVRGV